MSRLRDARELAAWAAALVVELERGDAERARERARALVALAGLLARALGADGPTAARRSPRAPRPRHAPRRAGP